MDSVLVYCREREPRKRAAESHQDIHVLPGFLGVAIVALTPHVPLFSYSRPESPGVTAWLYTMSLPLHGVCGLDPLRESIMVGPNK